MPSQAFAKNIAHSLNHNSNPVHPFFNLRLYNFTPILRRVANTAIGSILPVVLILIRVTGNTSGRRTLVNPVFMTGCTSKLCMMSDQWKIGILVVKSDIRPPAGCMAGTAVRAKLTIMFIA